MPHVLIRPSKCMQTFIISRKLFEKWKSQFLPLIAVGLLQDGFLATYPTAHPLGADIQCWSQRFHLRSWNSTPFLQYHVLAKYLLIYWWLWGAYSSVGQTSIKSVQTRQKKLSKDNCDNRTLLYKLLWWITKQRTLHSGVQGLPYAWCILRFSRYTSSCSLLCMPVFWFIFPWASLECFHSFSSKLTFFPKPSFTYFHPWESPSFPSLSQYLCLPETSSTYTHS